MLDLRLVGSTFAADTTAKFKVTGMYCEACQTDMARSAITEDLSICRQVECRRCPWVVYQLAKPAGKECAFKRSRLAYHSFWRIYSCFSLRNNGVKVIPTNKPSGARKRLTVWPQGLFLVLDEHVIASRFQLGCNPFYALDIKL